MSSDHNDSRTGTDRPGRAGQAELPPAPKEAELIYLWRLTWAERHKPRPERPDLQAFVDSAERPIVRRVKQVPDDPGT